EDAGLAEAQVEALAAVGVLVQQVAQIRGGPVRGRDCQEHETVLRSSYSSIDTPASPVVHREQIQDAVAAAQVQIPVELWGKIDAICPRNGKKNIGASALAAPVCNRLMHRFA